MCKYYLAQDGDNSFYIEVDKNNDKDEDASSDGTITGRIQNAVDDAIIVAATTINKMKKLQVDEIEVEFGIKVGIESGAAFWAISKATGEANFTIKASWKSISK